MFAPPDLTPFGVFLLLLLFPLTGAAEDTRFETTHFSGSGNCADCHDGLTDQQGDDVSIVQDWQGSMMANSVKNPFWQARVAVEMERNPHLTDMIQDVCTRCHAPMANHEADGDLRLFGEGGLLDPSNPLHDAAMNGVSCTYCHQIEETAELGTLAGFSGNATISDKRVAYGQFSDILQQPMINQVGYTPLYSAHISGSALCATCHNLKTAFVDANGDLASSTPESEFPEQMPYTEWEHSVFDDGGSNPQSCQDCHMPATRSKVSSRPGWLAGKEGFAKHNFAGANSVMLTLLRDNAAVLDVDTTNIDENITLSRELLRSAVKLEVVSATRDGDHVEARLRLTNNSGHKTPTSYPSRRMWIHFRVTDSDGRVVFESGKPMPDGSVAGADNDADQALFEPHYDLIDAPEQVQIYESVTRDTDGKLTHTLLRAAGYLKDNRLTPRGFDKNRVPRDVAVVGEALRDSNFNQGSDEISYRFSSEGTGDLRLTATLYYQVIAHGLLQDLFAETGLPQVRSFQAMYEKQALKYEPMASVESLIGSGIDISEDASSSADSSSGGGGAIGLPMLLLMLLLGIPDAAAARRAARWPLTSGRRFPWRRRLPGTGHRGTGTLRRHFRNLLRSPAARFR